MGQYKTNIQAPCVCVSLCFRAPQARHSFVYIRRSYYAKYFLLNLNIPVIASPAFPLKRQKWGREITPRHVAKPETGISAEWNCSVIHQQRTYNRAPRKNCIRGTGFGPPPIYHAAPGVSGRRSIRSMSASGSVRSDRLVPQHDFRKWRSD